MSYPNSPRVSKLTALRAKLHCARCADTRANPAGPRPSTCSSQGYRLTADDRIGRTYLARA
jgi:hypothetical protein